MRPFRQGDILLVPVDGLLARGAGARVVRRTRKLGIVVAEGEATGHHHRIVDSDARMVRKGNRVFIRTPKDHAAELIHEEHSTIELPANTTLEVVRQREHVPAPKAAPRQVRTQQVWD